MFSLTVSIIVITALVSVPAFSQRQIFDQLKYSPYHVQHNKQSWRLLSHALLHGDWTHLIVNMYVLFSFGSITEKYYEYYFESKGIIYFLLLYIGGVLFSALPAMKHKNNAYYNAVGASGAVSAVLFASILFQPASTLRLIFIPIDIPAVVFGVLYLGYEAYMNKKSQDNIAHDAHFWGALFGFGFTLILKPGLFFLFLEEAKSIFS